jgi:hypothetical protein
MNHAIDAGEGCAATLVAMGIELLFGENITTSLGFNEK